VHGEGGAKEEGSWRYQLRKWQTQEDINLREGDTCYGEEGDVCEKKGEEVSIGKEQSSVGELEGKERHVSVRQEGTWEGDVF